MIEKVKSGIFARINNRNSKSLPYQVEGFQTTGFAFEPGLGPNSEFISFAGQNTVLAVPVAELSHDDFAQKHCEMSDVTASVVIDNRSGKQPYTQKLSQMSTNMDMSQV